MKQWWENFPTDDQPSQGGIVTRPADPLRPGQVTIQNQTIRQNQGEIEALPYKAREAEAQARKAEADAKIAEANARGAGEAKAAELNQQDEYNTRRGQLEAVEEQIRITDSLWRNSLKGGFPNFIAGRIPTDEVGEFNTAGSQILDVGQNVFRTPGQGSQDQREYQGKIEALKPISTDSDKEIGRKLDYLKMRVDEQRRALGLDPVGWESQITPPSMDRTRVTVGSGDQAQQQTISNNGMRVVEDPKLKAIAVRLGKMVAAGEPDEKILQFIRDAKVGEPHESVIEALRYRRTPEYQQWKRQNPHKPYPISPEMWQREVPLGKVEQITNDPMLRSPGAYVTAAGQALTGNRLDDVAGFLGGNPNQVTANSEMLRDQHPYASLAGDVTGQGMVDLGLYGGGRLVNFGGRFAPLARDAIYGAYSGSGANNEDPLAGAGLGVVANAAGGAAGRGAQRSIGAAATGVKDQTLNYLNDRGLDMTVGQMARASESPLGKLVAWTEDRFAGLPGTDATIGAARYRGAESFNKAAFSEAGSAPINAVGEEGSEQLTRAVSAAYSAALDGVTVARDRTFNTQWGGLTARGSRIARYGDDFKGIVDDIDALFDASGQLTGDRYQEAIQIIRRADAEFAGQPGYGRFSKELDHLEGALTSLVNRQRPDVTPALEAANKLNSKKKIVQRAVKSRTAQRNDSLVSPAELNQQSIMNTERFGGLDAATSTNRPFYDLTTNALKVQPGDIPDSGTAGRNWIVPLAGASLMAGGQGLAAASGSDNLDAAGGAGSTLGALALASSLPYSKTGQRAIQKGLLGERPQMIDELGKLLKKYPQLSGLLGASAFRNNYIGDEPQP